MVAMVGERTTAFNNIHIFLQCTGSPKEYIHINALRTRRLIDATGAIGAFESYNRGGPLHAGRQRVVSTRGSCKPRRQASARPVLTRPVLSAKSGIISRSGGSGY